MAKDSLDNDISEGDYLVWKGDGNISRLTCIAGYDDYKAGVVVTLLVIELPVPYQGMTRYVARSSDLMLYPEQDFAAEAFARQRQEWLHSGAKPPHGLVLTRASAVAGSA